jgi:methionyl-tRNA formyltransferase
MLRIVFMGTPDFSVAVLAELLGAGHQVVAVYCQPPRPAGRGMGETKSPVQVFAEASGLRVLTPKSLKAADVQAQFSAHDADVAVVVAYGLLLPQVVLDAPKYGCLNIHASQLPRWRGAAPIQRAIMAGDRQTTVMIMQMDAGLDTGPVCLSENISIGDNTTAGELHDELSRSGAGLVVRALAALERGSLHATAQSDVGATYAAKIDKAEAQLDFSWRANDVHNHVRGLSPWPGAWFEIDVASKRERIKVLRTMLVPSSGPDKRQLAGTFIDDQGTIACGHDAVRLVEVQRAGKKPMSVVELQRGFALPKGAVIRRS